MIYFRADANPQLASGHIMRCITIALECIRRGNKVKFLIADENPVVLLERYGIEYLVIGTDWKKPMEEIKVLSKILNRNNDIVILDSYLISSKYTNLLRKYSKLVCIEDQFVEKQDVDLLINYNVYYFIFDYKDIYSNSSTKLLLGTKYTPLRGEFREKSSVFKVNTRVNNILLMCGGSDDKNFILDFLKQYQIINLPYKIHVIIGTYNKFKQKIKSMYSDNDNICIYENVNNISDIMSKCDLAISAAGNSLYELYSIGIPTVYFAYSDNQKYDCIGFGQDDMARYAGNIDYGKKELFMNILNDIKLLSNDWNMRNTISENMREFIDCNGTCRIVDSIMEDYKKC